ncbi:hypothetical protein IWW34DRAFT_735385 [Fusarium oxysporum f. sp. albedinis]|nr:hypothetical protein IWW34DRAFT_735385 [Fusarium oxysporum f. sp. albedinis]
MVRLGLFRQVGIQMCLVLSFSGLEQKASTAVPCRDLSQVNSLMFPKSLSHPKLSSACGYLNSCLWCFYWFKGK